MTQHGTGNFTDERLDWLHERQERAYELLTQCAEGPHTHYYGVTADGHKRPLTDQQAHAARLAGVAIDLPDTALLAQRDGE